MCVQKREHVDGWRDEQICSLKLLRTSSPVLIGQLTSKAAKQKERAEIEDHIPCIYDNIDKLLTCPGGC